MKRGTLVAAGALIISALTATNADANLVTNGSFETGDLSGWVANPVSFPIYTVTAPVAVGQYAAQIAGFDFDPDTLSQTVATAAGAAYTLSFYYWQDTSTPNGLDVTWNGTSVFSQVDTDTGVAYVQIFANVIGTGSDSLVFTAYNNPAFTYIDGVSLDSVPEPAAWAMMLAGFGGMGVVLRNRRRMVTVTA